MVFVPFTGIDHHQKCVTFGAALLSNEKYESYCWMLECFLKTHGKQPPLALTDQDAALRKAVLEIFPDSHHRLCMWHITQKLPGKVILFCTYLFYRFYICFILITIILLLLSRKNP